MGYGLLADLGGADALRVLLRLELGLDVVVPAQGWGVGLGAAAWAFVRAEEGEAEGRAEGEAEGRAEGSGWREVAAPLEQSLEVLLARLADIREI